MRNKYSEIQNQVRADHFKVGDLIGVTSAGHMRGEVTESCADGSAWHLEWRVIEGNGPSQWTGSGHVTDTRMELLVPDLVIEEEPW